jgi:hypothetical protein
VQILLIANKRSRGKKGANAENRANEEIPLFLALRAVKMSR